MTKVDVNYRFCRGFEERWARSIEALKSVYGLQSLQLWPDAGGIKVGYDASRLKVEDVTKKLRAAGLPVELAG